MYINKRKNIEKLIKKVCTKVIKNDKYLLENNLNERSITHKLAEYMQQEIPDWDVDCEYNRDSDKVKVIRFGKLKPKKILSDDTEGRTVFPDIIVHRRGTRENLIAIEVKKNSSRFHDEDDLDKIKGYIHDLNYLHGFFIKFPIKENISLSNIEYRYINKNNFIGVKGRL